MRNIGMLLAVAGVVAAAPAHAVLQLSLNVSGTAFTCVDQAACDTDPTVGIVQLATTTINGVRIGSGFSFDMTADGVLFSSANAVTNISGSNRTVTGAVSATGFTGPINYVDFSGSGTWLRAGTQQINMAWYLDPADTQGANTATDTPGTLLGTFTQPFSGTTGSFSSPTFRTTILAGGPYSMTEAFTYTLIPGATISRSLSMVAAPEPAPLALLGVGLLGLGIARPWRRKR